MEREVGGGIGMGNTCKPMAISFQCMTKFTTNKKKIRLLYSVRIDYYSLVKKKKSFSFLLMCPPNYLEWCVAIVEHSINM